MPRTHTLFHRLLRRLAPQDGIALVVALGAMTVLGIAGTSAMVYTSQNYGSAARSQADQKAFSLAEAGINNAAAVLSLESNNALDPNLLPPAPPSPDARTDVYEDGTVTWGGTLDAATGVWTLRAVGQMRNPTGAGVASVRRTVGASVRVRPTLNQPLNNMAWDYIFSKNTGTASGCDQSLANSVNMQSRFYVMGNLCLDTPSQITGGPLLVKGDVKLATNTNIGAPGKEIEAHIGGSCTYHGGVTHYPCAYGSAKTGGDNVWAAPFDTNVQSITPPTADFYAWYLNGNPGPYFPCAVSSGTPPVFDDLVAPPGSTDDVRLSYRNNSAPVANLTPPASYTCQSAGGELSWDAARKHLTVRGAIYIDGSAEIENAGNTTITYDGQATLYLTGTFLLKNTNLCAGLDKTGGDCAFETWDPNKELLIVVADGNGDNGIPAGDGIQFVSAHFQGGLYATHSIELDTFSQSAGPMIAGSEILGQSVKTFPFPYLTTVPPGTP
ncbi:MAG: hypothetical protein M3M94_00370, partial [Actinomycetota bacterium]|nr:hypothetical protein [Actinomycetota bacterium]